MNDDFHPDRTSDFVTLAFTGTFCSMLAAHAAFEMANESVRADLAELGAGQRPSCCLLLVSCAAWRVCAAASVMDAESLDEVLRTVRRQFVVTDDCPPGLRERALSLLEHCFDAAVAAARRALSEAATGFPVSQGSFAHWTKVQRWRSAKP